MGSAEGSRRAHPGTDEQRPARFDSSKTSSHLQEYGPRSSRYRPRSALEDLGESGTDSRGTSYHSASDLDSFGASDEYEDWSDIDEDVEMEDATQSPLLSRPSPSPQPYTAASPHREHLESRLAAAERTPTFHSQATITTAPPRMNVTHGYSGSGYPWRPPGDIWTNDTTRICIVCKTKPVYRSSTGFQPYPTCGMKCAARLQQEKDDRAPPRTSRTSRSSKCVVCGVKDRYDNPSTGKRYPTCGTTCASKLKASSEAEKGKCDLCHKRPKAVNPKTGKPYPFCGPQCRDKSKASFEKAMEGTCRTCLLEVADQASLLPNRHRRFQDSWNSSSDVKTIIQHMYFFAQSFDVRARYGNHKDALKSSQRGRAPTEKELWVAVLRECNAGDSGDITRCGSSTCHSAVSSVAEETLSGMGPTRSTKVLMNVRLAYIPGKRTPDVTEQHIMSYGADMRKEHPVVKIVTNKGVRRVETGQMHVFEPAAILPLGCVVYTTSASS
ncbi:hypothetical protein NMY22_g4208 [Coprinellus aureogranulatus]|nr:hypothetical protein NMY22_g4208 [Coprinellus aureogranulatus]